MTFTSSVGASGLGADCSRQGRGVRKYCETESQVIEMIHLTGLYHSLIKFLVFMLISSNCGVLLPNIRKTNTFSHFDVKLLLKHRMYSHIKQHILHTLHTDPHFYTETRPHTHIPVVSPAPNALTSSLYPPSLLLLLQSLSVSSDRRRRTPPRTALQEREGEKRAEIERDRERETELEKA